MFVINFSFEDVIMKYFLLAVFFASYVSTANAGPGSSKMSGVINEFNNFSRKVPVKRHSTRSTQTSLKTKGFRPTRPIDTSQWHTLEFPKKVEYVDEAHETFKAPPGFQEKIEQSLRRRDVEQSSKFDDGLKKK
jgi:hypothetical protein